MGRRFGLWLGSPAREALSSLVTGIGMQSPHRHANMKVNAKDAP
jgi:hypothetical protein